MLPVDKRVNLIERDYQTTGVVSQSDAIWLLKSVGQIVQLLECKTVVGIIEEDGSLIQSPEMTDILEQLGWTRPSATNDG